MTSPAFFHRARFALWLAAAMLLFAALSPTLNALRAQSQPRLFAELCTALGVQRFAIDTNAATAQESGESGEQHHGIECAWCLQPGQWLSMGNAPAPVLPAAIGRNPSPVLAFQPVCDSCTHTIAYSRGPPPTLLT
jgi:hypothetical protein